MNITFVSGWPVDSPKAFSGTPYFMLSALQKSFDVTQTLVTARTVRSIIESCDESYIKSELSRIGEQISQELLKSDSDLVLCLGNGIVPFLDTCKPIVLWHDSIWYGVLPMNFDQFKREYPLYHQLDQLTLDKCAMVVVAADWLKELCETTYTVQPKKLQVIPFGANIGDQFIPSIKNILKNRVSTPYQLTFIGKNWQMKGLPLAFEVCERLIKTGRDVVLNVIGTSVPRVTTRRAISHRLHYHRFTEKESFMYRYSRAAFVNDLGFLNKDEPLENQKFIHTLEQTHFLLHPTSFDCFGLVLAEANAHGVPALTTDIMGPRSVVRDGMNGYKFANSDFVDSAVKTIDELMQDPKKYLSLAKRAYSEYQTRLNWSVSITKLFYLLETQIISSTS
jgi:glycosyltransferase involved in cell wall biosynthesis